MEKFPSCEGNTSKSEMYFTLIFYTSIQEDQDNMWESTWTKKGQKSSKEGIGYTMRCAADFNSIVFLCDYLTINFTS